MLQALKLNILSYFYLFTLLQFKTILLDKLLGAGRIDMFQNCKRAKVIKTQGKSKCFLKWFYWGGIWLDIDLILLENLELMFESQAGFISSLSTNKNTVAIGVLAVTPKHPILIDALEFAISIEKPIQDYLAFTRKAYELVKSRIHQDVSPGSIHADDGNFYFLQERCDESDTICLTDGLPKKHRTFGCCRMYLPDKDKALFKSKYSDYPW